MLMKMLKNLLLKKKDLFHHIKQLKVQVSIIISQPPSDQHAILDQAYAGPRGICLEINVLCSYGYSHWICSYNWRWLGSPDIQGRVSEQVQFIKAPSYGTAERIDVGNIVFFGIPIGFSDHENIFSEEGIEKLSVEVL